MAITFPPHLSYSALSSYAECGERYRLERGFGKNNSTWFSTIAGTAIHLITEQYDLARDFGTGKGAPLPKFEDVFIGLLQGEVERGRVVKASGRVGRNLTSTGGPNKKDRDWWLHFGPEYVERWIAWREENPNWKLAMMPDGQPGVEVAVSSPMADIPFKGFIDRVFLVDGETTVVVDIKNGNAPASKLQLATYRVALFKQYGLDVKWGGYWMGKDGEFAGGLVDLTHFDQGWLEHQFAMARAGIAAGVFLPNVTSMCKGCGVRDYCRAVAGPLADEVPVQTEVQITSSGLASQSPVV